MAINPGRTYLKPGKTAFLICDVQTKPANHIYEIDKMLTNISKMISISKILNIPVIVTEQKDLGTTVPELDISSANGPFPKTQGSMCTTEVRKVLSKICSGSRPEAVVLMGIETHLCVEHTAMDLRSNGLEVHVLADCVSSRTKEDRHRALERMKQFECFIATTENVIFKLMGGEANHDRLKDILRLIKAPTSHI